MVHSLKCTNVFGHPFCVCFFCFIWKQSCIHASGHKFIHPSICHSLSDYSCITCCVLWASNLGFYGHVKVLKSMVGVQRKLKGQSLFALHLADMEGMLINNPPVCVCVWFMVRCSDRKSNKLCPIIAQHYIFDGFPFAWKFYIVITLTRSFLFYFITWQKKKKMLLRTDLHGINIVLSQFWDIQSVLTNTLKPSHGVTTIYFAICHVRENCCKGHKMICLFIIPQVWLHVPLLRVCLHVQEECWLRSRSGALLAPQQEGSHVDVKKHSI